MEVMVPPTDPLGAEAEVDFGSILRSARPADLRDAPVRLGQTSRRQYDGVLAELHAGELVPLNVGAQMNLLRFTVHQPNLPPAGSQ